MLIDLLVHKIGLKKNHWLFLYSPLRNFTCMIEWRVIDPCFHSTPENVVFSYLSYVFLSVQRAAVHVTSNQTTWSHDLVEYFVS